MEICKNLYRGTAASPGDNEKGSVRGQGESRGVLSQSSTGLKNIPSMEIDTHPTEKRRANPRGLAC